MIDEIDSATNNQVFIDFLAKLRGYYNNRNKYATFQSVIVILRLLRYLESIC
ncbi:MAG: hypothetical protein IJ106_15460 [Parasporobacterium sp.]|nr:hypothetical protein [Parasporobacterium sp.]